jgi:hypothetical protein
MDEGVRIPELKLDKFPFDLDRFVFVVGRREGMVSVKTDAGKEQPGYQYESGLCEFHWFLHT